MLVSTGSTPWLRSRAAGEKKTERSEAARGVSHTGHERRKAAFLW